MTSPLRLGIVGPHGRMGASLVQLAGTQADLLVAATIVQPGEPGGVTLAAAPPLDVLIDFSHREAVQTHATWVAEQGVAWVLGTTGLTDEDQRAVDVAAQHALVFQAANFSIGVALLIDLAARAAKILGIDADIEISEVHHRHKRDAPSGTALAIGRAVAQARGQDLEAVRRDDRSGLVGERKLGEIGLHALRLADVVGEHEISFAWPDERLRMSHDARDRRVFAQGALRAARFCAQLQSVGQSSGRVGMAELLAS
jgi:4-hydroxy-tetrahydrodipicolinate reductase